MRGPDVYSGSARQVFSTGSPRHGGGAAVTRLAYSVHLHSVLNHRSLDPRHVGDNRYRLSEATRCPFLSRCTFFKPIHKFLWRTDRDGDTRRPIRSQPPYRKYSEVL